MQYQALVAGLGNPGPQYAETRHNIGFMVIDAIVEEAERVHYRRLERLPAQPDYELYSASLPRVRGDFLLAKPLTYMNLSGRAVSAIMRAGGIRPASLLVIHDEMDLPLGRMKIKTGGSAAGHNGVQSIIDELGSEAFIRLRLGIGRPEQGGAQSKDWVLSPFLAGEREALEKVIAEAKEAVSLIFKSGAAAAMQRIHAFDAAPD